MAQKNRHGSKRPKPHTAAHAAAFRAPPAPPEKKIPVIYGKPFVVLEDATSLSESDLLRVCRDELEGFMVPRTVALVPSLPKNANGKIDKLALRKKWASGGA